MLAFQQGKFHFPIQSDIHEIGKSLVATMMLANGFHGHDLGVDVAVERTKHLLS